MMETAKLALLKRSDFRKLFIAYLVTYSGSAMAPIAMAFGVLELTGSARSASYVAASQIGAQVLVLLFGGVMADRMSRQRLMVISDAVAAVAQLSMAGLFLTGNAHVPWLMALMMINGAAYGFNQPAVNGFIPQVVERPSLQAANALLGAARSAALMLGAAAAGLLVAGLGVGYTIALDGLSFAIAALLIATMRVRTATPAEAASFLEDIRLGWREFIAHQWLWTIVVQFSLVVAALEATFGLLGPATARDAMGGSVDWGFIAGGFGAGTVVGGLAAMRMNVERPMLTGTLFVFLLGAIPLALALQLPLGWLIAVAFAAGASIQVFGVLWYTTLQKEIPPHLLSRVAAYDHFGSVALAPLGVVAAGWVYEIIGGREALLIAAGMMIVPTALVLLVPGVRELRTR